MIAPSVYRKPGMARPLSSRAMAKLAALAREAEARRFRVVNRADCRALCEFLAERAARKSA